MRDRETAIEVIGHLIDRTVLLGPERAELIVDAYEALPVQITDEMVRAYRQKAADLGARPSSPTVVRKALQAALNPVPA